MESREFFHECRSAGRKFTQDEWWAYLRQVDENPDAEIQTRFGDYVFNVHDICLNPDKVRIEAEKGCFGYWCEIKYAECGNGLWSFGISYCTGTGGGGYGVAYADEHGDPSKWRFGSLTLNEGLVAMCDYLVKRVIQNSGAPKDKLNKLNDKIMEYRRSIGRPTVVQLELF